MLGTDVTKGMTQIEWAITHLCDKLCSTCGQRVQESDYKGLTVAQYAKVKESIRSHKDICSWIITGGEPLCHPNFEGLMRKLLADFPYASVTVLTNGGFLPRVDRMLFRKLKWRLTIYPGWNDGIVAAYREKPNVELTVLRVYGHDDPDTDPRLTEEQARYTRERCWFHVFLAGTKMYGCCLAESHERHYKLPSIHVEFDKDWKEKWGTLETWRACQRCYEAERRIRMKG